MTARDVTGALARHFDYRRNVIVPRCYFAGSEADLLVLRGSDWLEEYEVKVTLSDYRREFEAKAEKHARLVHGRRRGNLMAMSDEDFRLGNVPVIEPERHLLHRFWFAIPLDLWPKIKPILPEHAGCVTVNTTPGRGGLGYTVVAVAKQAPVLRYGRKLTQGERCKLCELAYIRFWDIEAKEAQAAGL